jgi:hypothetical protein
LVGSVLCFVIKTSNGVGVRYEPFLSPIYLETLLGESPSVKQPHGLIQRTVMPPKRRKSAAKGKAAKVTKKGSSSNPYVSFPSLFLW